MQIGPRIRIRGSLGKLGDKAKKVVQKVASNPLAQAGLGFLTGGATIPLLAGTLGGALKEHAGIGDVVKGAAQGGLAGQGGASAKSLLRGRGLLGGAKSAVSSAPSTTTAAAAAPANPLALKPVVAGVNAPASVASAAAPAPASLMGTARSALSSVGRFAQNNPTATAMGLSAASNALTSGSENRINDAQADLLEQRADETAYDFEQRKRREAAYKDLWSPLGTAIGSSYNGIAKNPYAVGA